MPQLLISIALHVGLLYLLSIGALGGQDGDKEGKGKPGHVKVKLLDKPTDTESKNKREKVPEDKGIVIKKEDALPPEQRVVEHKCGHFYTGIGVQNDGTRNCTITGVPKGYPADRAGLKAGDLIIWEEDSECPGRGPEGTYITLKIMRGTRVFTVKLVREKICTSPEE